jgi:hypothetical protein
LELLDNLEDKKTKIDAKFSSSGVPRPTQTIESNRGHRAQQKHATHTTRPPKNEAMTKSILCKKNKARHILVIYTSILASINIDQRKSF